MNPKAFPNLLPYDGNMQYIPQYLSEAKADALFTLLKNSLQWESEVYRFYGKEVISRRTSALVGDDGTAYTYSGNLKTAEPWPDLLLSVKKRLENDASILLNSCLCNYYPNGDVGMAWHQDNEPEMGKNPFIASVSLGETRRFKARHNKTKDVVDVMLEPGSLLIMSGEMQDHWQHALPPMKRAKGKRINLTFRYLHS